MCVVNDAGETNIIDNRSHIVILSTGRADDKANSKIVEYYGLSGLN
jgi:hypothetical protein